VETPEPYGELSTVDYGVVVAYLLFSIVLGLSFARRGRKDTDAFFVGSRGMPWWLVGIGLAATCFAADTPLWIGDIIYKRGIEGTWLHWVTAIGFSFYVFAIAPLWRRSGIITDIAFYELRYSGRAASWLRGLYSVYHSLILNVVMMSVSTLSIVTIMESATGLSKGLCVLITVGGAMVYCVVSGLWGIAATDFMQFFVTFFGSCILAIFALHVVGGPAILVRGLSAQETWPGHELNILPGAGAAAGLTTYTIFFIFAVRWMDNAAIGSYVSQRLFAARSTKEATLGAVLHACIYWSVVPLPWIITILAARLHLPELTEGQEAYPRMAFTILPWGLKGIMAASMLAAFMSTYTSLLSWGSSVALNDCYRRFCVKNAGPTHYVRVGQLLMLPMGVTAGLIAYWSDSIFNLLVYLQFLIVGVFSVQLARWIWWRVNAWSEVAALAANILIAAVIVILKPEWVDPKTNELYYGEKMLTVVFGTFLVWFVVTMVTKPTSAAVLEAFVRRVNPPGFWGSVRRRISLPPLITWPSLFYGWGIMLLAIYGPLAGLIKVVLGEYETGGIALAAGVVGIVLAVRKARGMDDRGEDGSVHQRSRA
jgi:Na+/proline symporter